MIFESLFISRFSFSSNFPISTKEAEDSGEISLILSSLWAGELCNMQPAIQAPSKETANLKLKSFLGRVIISFALLWGTFLPIAFTFRFGRIWVYFLPFEVSLFCSISKKYFLKLHNNTLYTFFTRNFDGNIQLLDSLAQN